MNALQTSTDVSSASGVSSESAELDPIRRFTGGYYRILGWVGVASIFVSIATSFWTDYLHFDLSFIFWFWLGRCLKEGNPKARKWAIALPMIFATLLILGYFIPGSRANFGGLQYDSSHPIYSAISALIIAIFTVPAVGLITKKGRASFRKEKEGEQVGDGDAEEAV